jgi:muramoyltetrapeptide carboxypeptidase
MHIRVIAPSSPFSVEELLRGVELLRARYVVSYDPGLLERTGFLAGSDERRLQELRSAIADASVDAIFAARGGYGATRILPGLDPGDVAARGPMLVGFSDITALHALWARAGVGSVHGPMVAALGRGDETQLARMISAVEGRGEREISGLVAFAPARAKARATGPLLGGNLAVLTALLGTPYFPDLRGAIVLLEDIGERPYRVDRMLTSLVHSGQLDAIAGIVLGAFTQAVPAADGVTVEEVLRERLSGLGVPVLGGAPIGHLELGNLPVVLGALAELDAERGSLVFTA